MTPLPLRPLAAAALTLALPLTTHAVDGVTLITQAKALAGNVTPGDAPGFPVTISRSGSFRLSQSLTVDDLNQGAIETAADTDVDLDLNGFTIQGARCGTSRCQIEAPQVSGITAWGRLSLHGGGVRGFGGHGVFINLGGRVERVHAQSHGLTGIVVNGEAQVTDSQAVDNVNGGIFLSVGVARGNVVTDNGVYQLQAYRGLASGNHLSGINPLVGLGNGVVSRGDNACQASSSSMPLPC